MLSCRPRASCLLAKPIKIINAANNINIAEIDLCTSVKNTGLAISHKDPVKSDAAMLSKDKLIKAPAQTPAIASSKNDCNSKLLGKIKCAASPHAIPQAALEALKIFNQRVAFFCCCLS